MMTMQGAYFLYLSLNNGLVKKQAIASKEN
jgi:hypothetical protein